MTTETTTQTSSHTDSHSHSKKKRLKKWAQRIFFLTLLAGGLWYGFGRPEAPKEYITERVQTGTVRQIVEVSGTVESDTKRDLVFQASGKISSIAVSVGSKVEKSALLATLDSTSLNIEVERMRAGIAMAQAELDLQYAGPILQDIQISKTRIAEAKLALTHSAKKLQDTKQAHNKKQDSAEQEVENAKIALANAEAAYSTAQESGSITKSISGKSSSDTLIEAQKVIISGLDTIQNSLSTAADILGTNVYGQESSQKTFIGFYSPQEKINAYNEYRRLSSQFEYLDIQGSGEKHEIEEALTALEIEIQEHKALMDTLFVLLNTSATGTNLTNEDIAIYKTAVSRDQGTLVSSLDALRDAKRDIIDASLHTDESTITTTGNLENAHTNRDQKRSILRGAEKNLSNIIIQNKNDFNSIRREMDTKKLLVKKAEENHAKLIAKPRSVDVASYQARVQQQVALWKQAVQNLEDTKIIAPADGIITEINREEGENIQRGDTIITLQTKGLQMKLNIPETDITKLSVGNTAVFTLDAFAPDEVFTGTIIDLSPAETVIQGVIYYEATVGFDARDPRIQSGMTSDIEILSAEKTNVLMISPESLRFEENQPFVFVLNDGEQERRDISLGIEGEDAIEVLDGLEEGDRVVLYEKEE